jgi:hypothetical protein
MDVADLAARFEGLLSRHYVPGLGITPSVGNENFSGQLWVRDFAHAGIHFFIASDPQAVEDSIDSVLRHQRPDGALPFRVEREYLLLKLAPGFRWLARPLFSLIEERFRGRAERPVYYGEDLTYAEDTVPVFLLLCESYRASGERGRTFVSARDAAIRDARESFISRCGEDGLLDVRAGNVDWADSITRGGALGLLNVLWVRSLEGAGHARAAAAKSALLERLYDRSGAYVRAAVGDERLDTAATILGALFFLDAAECVRVEETLVRRVACPTGFSNFDPPYPYASIRLPFKLLGHSRYHNTYVWPWVFLQNIHVKLKIAREHADERVRARYRDEARADLERMGRLFDETGGAYEIYLPDAQRPAESLFYRPPRFFLASMAGFVSAQRALQRLLQSPV